MTTADVSHRRPSVFGRAWQAFRRWRRARPFWGGLFTLLSALEYYLSGHLNLLSLQVHIGPEGFLSYVVPLVLLLCGLLTWFTPGQRIFYGIIAAATAIYGLIGLNLGGFGLGMLLGMLGGALGASWTPVTPPSTEGPEVPPPGETTPGPAEATGPPGDGSGYDPNTTTLDNVLGGSPLTDTLPRSTISPLHRPPEEPDEGGGPAGELPRRTPRITGLSVLLILVLVLGVVAGVHVTPATAAPCPTPSATANAPSASPSASPTGGSTSAGGGVLGVIDGLLNGIARLFGGGTSTPSPSASPSPGSADSARTAGTPSDCVGPTAGTGGKSTPTTGPSAAPGKGVGRNSASPKPSASASAGATRKLATAPDQPPVPTHPGIITTDTLTMTALSYDGVVNLPLKSGGTVAALQFSMDLASNVPFELDMTDGGAVTAQVSSKLEISGHVKFYCSRMQGNLLGLIPSNYTPDSPPPLVPGLTLPIPIFFTAVKIDLVYVHADTLSAPNLHGFDKT